MAILHLKKNNNLLSALGTQRRARNQSEAFSRRPLLLLLLLMLLLLLSALCVCARKVFLFLATFLWMCVLLLKVIKSLSSSSLSSLLLLLLFTVSQLANVVVVACHLRVLSCLVLSCRTITIRKIERVFVFNSLRVIELSSECVCVPRFHCLIDCVLWHTPVTIVIVKSNI